jgi:hypothetical protein
VNPADKLKEGTARWNAVSDAVKAEAKRIHKEREEATPEPLVTETDVINQTGA